MGLVSDTGRHPGEVLLEDFLKPPGITQYRPAKSLGVSRRRTGEIIAGKWAVTADTALWFARFSATDALIWMNFQVRDEPEKTRNDKEKIILREIFALRSIEKRTVEPEPPILRPA